MPITYDIEKDHLFKRGVKQGIEQGKRLTIIEMLKDPSLTIEKVARFTDTSVAFVQQVKKEQQ